MIYLFDSELPNNKSVLFALSYIYGIGKNTSFLICKKLGFSQNLRVSELSKEQIGKILKLLEELNLLLGSDLKKSRLLIIKQLTFIKSYRGLRRYQGLPVRGQRTHTNAKTSRKRK